MQTDLFTTWVERVKNPKFRELHERDIRRKFYVCERHFTADCIVPGGGKIRLKRNAIPSLYLPGYKPIPDDQSSQPVCTTPEKISVQSSLPNSSISESPYLQVSAVPEESSSHDFNRAQPESPYLQVSAVSERNSSLAITPVQPGRSLKRQVTCASNSSSKSKRVRRNILKEIGFAEVKQLTPRKTKLYSLYKREKKRVSSLKQWCAGLKRRYNFVKRKDHILQQIRKSVNATTFKFIQSQVRVQRYRCRGRRFSLDDKLLGLVLYKSGPRTYRLLQKIFALPSRQVIFQLLQKLPINTGINKSLFSHLKDICGKMSPTEKYCNLIFDEMSLMPDIAYNKCSNQLEGFVDCGKGKREQQFAEHALVFMLRGICRNWKQPIVFMFTSSKANHIQLKSSIKEVIEEVLSCGFNLVSIVCDQAKKNIAAINSLLKDTHDEFARKGKEFRGKGFIINEKEIVPIYDPPHLLKGIRNNLINKNVHFEENVASWRHILQFYSMDQRADGLRVCRKLTDEHVIPSKIKKMKVSYCAQIFSYSLSSIMRSMVDWGVIGLDKEAKETADFLWFMDQLFDSVNGVTRKCPNGKPLRCAVSEGSNHHEFWTQAKNVLKSVKFFCPQKGKFVSVDSVKNWIVTIENLSYLWTKLHSQGLKFLCLRHFNQDPIENFFGCVRSHGVRNVNPTVLAFKGSFKSMIINNVMAYHSPKANCVQDTATSLLVLKNLVCGHDNPAEEVFNPTITIPASLPTRSFDILGNGIKGYISEYIARCIYFTVGHCQTCLSNLKRDIAEKKEVELYISSCEFPESWLCRPNTYFMYITGEAIALVMYLLPQICAFPNVIDCLVLHIKKNINFVPLVCREHPDLVTLFCKRICTVCIYQWCKDIRLIIRNKNQPFANLVQSGSKEAYIDPIKKKAYTLSLKYLRF